MDSLTKNKKAKHEIVNLLKHCMDLKAEIAAISELTQGSFNAVYQIRLSDGTCCVLKIAPSADVPILRNEKNIMQAEVEALRLVRKHTQVPVPEVLYDADHSSYCDSPFMIMQWMDGEAYQSASNRYADETKKHILFDLGAMAYALHQIHGTKFGRLGKGSVPCSTWDEAFAMLFQNVLEDGMDAHVALPLHYDALFQLAERVNPFLKDVKMPCLLHGDLWMGNVLVHNQNISALLDFERSLWGDPLMEYPFGLLRNNAAFLEGYGRFELDDSDVSAHIRRSLYNLYHYLIAKIEKPYRGFPGGNSDYFINQKILAEVNAIEKLFLQ